MIDLGTVKPGSTIRIPFSSFDKDDGSSITMTNYAAADMLIYKDGNTTERASASGFTATTDFDAKTGKHLAIIDLADNTTAAFWNAGSEYLVAIDAVTVDAVTTGGWIARFRIGYPNAHLDTTLASLASQTSFTLTTGPAEDDALNGSVVCIHDIASSVQCGWGVVADYTGSTKTVTLTAGVTFTAASGDNISFFPPVNAAFWNALATVKLPLAPTTAGRDLDVSAGGEAGIDWANVGSPTTALNLSATNIDVDQIVASVSGAVGSVTGAVGSVTGLTAATVHSDLDDIQARLPAALTADGNIKADALRLGGTAQTGRDIGASVLLSAGSGAGQLDFSSGVVKANLAQILGTALTETAGQIAAAFKKFFNVATPTGTVNSIPDAVAGAAGGLFIAGTNAATTVTTALTTTFTGNLTGTIGGLTAAALKDFFDTDSATTYASAVAGSVVKEIADNAGGSSLTSADIADAVWEEAIADHSGTVGSTAEQLAAAGAAGDPWATAIPGAYGAGTAGKIVGDNVNATISSRASQTSVDTVDDFLDTEIAAIKLNTDNLPSDPADESLVIAATDAIMSRLGAPAGASVSADVAAVKTDTAAVKTKTDKLTFDADNAVDANVQKINDVPIVGDGSGTPYTV